MLFNILTLFPDFFKVPLSQGVVGRAFQKQILKSRVVFIRDFCDSDFHSLDDSPIGGGDGMVISYSPLKKALNSLSNKGRVLYLSPQGRKWNYSLARLYAKKEEALTLICGRYAGVDNRFLEECVDEEISIGDYVLSGGEAACLAIIDSLSRFIPGVLGSSLSAENETFENGLLEHPQWTKPQKIKGFKIPSVFFSGHHEKIQKTRYYLSLLKTERQRPDLLKKSYEKDLVQAKKWLESLSEEEKKACSLS